MTKEYYLKYKEELKEKSRLYYKNNKEICLERQRAWKAKNPEKKKQYTKNEAQSARRRNYKKKFNITIEDYNKMLENQQGCCGICNLSESSFTKAFAIDHCHKTGKVRGLLCMNCNQGLGKFKDDIVLLENSIKYLSK